MIKLEILYHEKMANFWNNCFYNYGGIIHSIGYTYYQRYW